LAAGVVIFIYCISQVSEVVNFLKNIADRAGIDTVYIQIVLKILAIAYLASFASEICKDAGAGSLASKVEFSGKMFILVLAIPILMAVLDSILQIL
ncbi:MAG: stage III sporulation protein AD, partial [Clostridium sp.]|nr:stage III sporulation protein AD [Clostridium sp.]